MKNLRDGIKDLLEKLLEFPVLGWFLAWYLWAAIVSIIIFALVFAIDPPFSFGNHMIDWIIRIICIVIILKVLAIIVDYKKR